MPLGIRVDDSPHRDLERTVLPDHFAVRDLTRNEWRAVKLNTERMELKAAVLEQCGNANLLIEVWRACYVIHAVLERAVRAHIMNYALRRKHDPISALLDTLDVLVERVARQGPSGLLHRDRPSHKPRRSGASADRGSVQPARMGGGILPCHPPGGVWKTGMPSAAI